MTFIKDFLWEMTKKYGIKEKYKNNVKGNGNGVKEIPVNNPESNNKNLSLFIKDFS